MPLHDWNRVPAGLFHDFHQSWSIRIKDTLNAALLHIRVPLEVTYQSSWEALPREIRTAVETGELPQNG